MVGQVGIEPTANCLRGNCSTPELLTHIHKRFNEQSGAILMKKTGKTKRNL